MPALSDRQQRILDYIMNFLQDQGFPPTIREICKEVGISSTSVTNYNLDKLENMGLLSRRREVSRGLSLNWDKLEESGLANGHSDPLAEQQIGDSSAAALLKVPVLGHIAAGEPIGTVPADKSTTDDWVELAHGMFKLTGSEDDYFALRVKGDSMIDASVLDGDIVILHYQETANNGDMVAAWIEDDEETTLKFLYKEGANVRLQPANPSYEPIVRAAQNVRINGRVVSVLRSLN